jgi:hypothetical protein
MSTGKKEDDAGIPEHLRGKERDNWIRRALGRPPDPKNIQTGLPASTETKASQQNTASGPQQQTYPGKPKHFQ